MKLAKVTAALLIIFQTLATSTIAVNAESQASGIVIAQVQTGSVLSASQEFISIYNNTDSDIDVTGWCLRYNGSATKPGCIVSPDTHTQLWLTARSYTTFASNEFILAHAGFVPQARVGFAGGMSDSGGSLSLVDASGQLQDEFSWDAKAASNKIYQRINVDAQTLKDTNIDAMDFAQTVLVLPANLGLFEQLLAPDLCSNIDGAQLTVPDGYEVEEGRCVLIPPEDAQIMITELLPNVSGSDAGREFVELYNPNNRAINLVGYAIQLGPDFSKRFIFLDGSLMSGEYMELSDAQLGFVLPNTTASVRVIAPDGTIVSTTDSYLEPKENESWALIDGSWQLTNRPTPGAGNMASLPEVVSESDVSGAVVACPEGKYRNPTTNRCRTLELASVIVPCDDDEYRNPETNRCRKLTVLSGSSLVACKPSQERNPETNRCREISTETTELQACDTGEVRNPETNRCKKSAVSVVGSGQNQTGSTGTSGTNFSLLLPVFALTGAYGLYEYRYDVLKLYLRVRQRLGARRGVGAE